MKVAIIFNTHRTLKLDKKKALAMTAFYKQTEAQSQGKTGPQCHSQREWFSFTGSLVLFSSCRNADVR